MKGDNIDYFNNVSQRNLWQLELSIIKLISKGAIKSKLKISKVPIKLIAIKDRNENEVDKIFNELESQEVFFDWYKDKENYTVEFLNTRKLKKQHDFIFGIVSKFNKKNNFSSESLSNIRDKKDDVVIITEGKTDWKYFIKALRYFHTRRPKQFLLINEDYFLRFGDQDDVDKKNCGTILATEMGDSELESYLISISKVKSKENSNFQKTYIGVYDSDNSKVKVINDKTNKVFSFKIEPKDISTEFLFKEKEIKTLLKGKRLFNGNEFDKYTKKLLVNGTISLGGDSANKAGKNCIIDKHVFNKNFKDIALSKDEFAQAVFCEKIKISNSSLDNFKNIFKSIENYLKK